MKSVEHLPSAAVIDSMGLYTKCKSDGSPYTQVDIDNYNNYLKSLPWYKRIFKRNKKLSDKQYFLQKNPFEQERIVKSVIVPVTVKNGFIFEETVFFKALQNSNTGIVRQIFAIHDGYEEQISDLYPSYDEKFLKELGRNTMTVKNRSVGDFVLENTRETL